MHRPRGQKEPYLYLYPENKYALAATHYILSILIALAADKNLELERADVSDVNLSGKVGVKVLMYQNIDSPGVPLKQEHVSELMMSIYGTFQAGEIQGSLFDNFLRS